MSGKIIEELRQARAKLASITPMYAYWGNILAWHAGVRPFVIKAFSGQTDTFDRFIQVQWAKFNRAHSENEVLNYNDGVVKTAKKRLAAFLDGIIRLAELEQEEVSETNLASKEPLINLSTTSEKCFIVHGHDDAMKQAVARTLEKLGLKPIILHEQYDGGRVIIEKLEQHGNVGFAVVLLSPDDTGYKKADGAKAAKPRARQNVILELGYFVGRLGRGKVMALKRGNDLEVPGDFDGVVYTPFDEHEGWQKKLVKELKAAGYDVDANAL